MNLLNVIRELSDFDTPLLANTIGYIDETPAHEYYLSGDIRVGDAGDRSHCRRGGDLRDGHEPAEFRHGARLVLGAARKDGWDGSANRVGHQNGRAAARSMSV